MAMLTAPLRSFVSTNVPRGFHSHLPRQHRTRPMVVRCLSPEEGQQEPNTASPPPQLPKAPKPSTTVSTKLSDIFAFSGPAPERINGRLAMIGFVAALGVELARGDDLMAQLMNGGVTWFVATSVLLSIASLVPLSKGVSPQSKSSGFMTSDAELWNGRFAMLGLVALFFTEFITGTALV